MVPSPWPTPLASERLRLRHWTAQDLAPFCAMNADPRVMEFFPSPLGVAESVALLRRIEHGIATYGFGLWVLELRATSRFIGCVGLGVPSFRAPFAPCVEIGWRLAYDYWGYGYATEAAESALAFGFEHLKLAQIVAFTASRNVRSQRLMQRLGMLRDPADDFNHPALPEHSPLCRHVLYRMTRARWQKHSSRALVHDLVNAALELPVSRETDE